VRTYEVIFILDPGLADDGVDAAANAAKAVVAKEGGEVVEVQKWGKKRLAYEVKKRREGHYVYFKVQAGPKAMSELTRHLKIAEPVLKQLQVLMPVPPKRAAKAAAPAAEPVAQEA
jgi:small subunit ribosomal protein S6